MVWNAGFNLFRDALQFLQMLILARLLDESAYGQFAFSTSVIGFIAVFSANPFLSYTLQVQRDEETHYQDHFTAAGVLQFSMFLVANLVGLMLARIPAYAAAAPLVHVLSLTFLLEWACELRRKMIERQFDFRTLRLLHAVGLSLATLTAIVMASDRMRSIFAGRTGHVGHSTICLRSVREAGLATHLAIQLAQLPARVCLWS